MAYKLKSQNAGKKETDLQGNQSGELHHIRQPPAAATNSRAAAMQQQQQQKPRSAELLFGMEAIHSADLLQAWQIWRWAQPSEVAYTRLC
mmetsp:Transcript_90659/g.174551  ORF Transcript_90659/g.174551 Transcript_90659/m.174551 type:complete len:90 (-) Transcript_90659:31-300(-)